MIKLFIVDDEEQIRNRIKNKIDWESHGIKVCGEATNGLEALERINETTPDILLTDIRMPIMDGFELIEKLLSKQLNTKSIIMSGYDDFSYAQKALKLGTVDYLLKPSRSQEILDTVLKVKSDLESENSRKELYSRLKLQFQESLPFLKEKYLNRLIRSADKNNITQKLKLFGTVLDSNYSTVALIRIDNQSLLQEKYGNEDFEIMKFAIKNISAEIISEIMECEVFENNDDIVCILKLEDYSFYNNLFPLLEKIIENIHNFLNFNVSMGLGRCYRGIASIHHSYNEALNALEMKCYHGEGKIVTYEDIIEEDTAGTSYPISEEKEILNSLGSGESKDLNCCVGEFFTALKIESSSKPNILKSILALFFSLYHFCIERNIETDEIFGHDFATLDSVLKIKSIPQMKEMLMDILKKINVTLTRGKSSNKIIEQAISFIKNNYFKDLSREIVAREVYITPGYLSILFKQELGTNFLEFLHKIRIEKACDMLKDKNAKTYQIAASIGYNDEKYFSQVFKKYTGMTPVHYREHFALFKS